MNDLKKRYEKGIQNTHNEHLRKAIKYYGIDAFEIIDNVFVAESKEELDAKEIELIRQYKATNKRYGYNYLSGTSTGKYQVYYDNGDRYDTYTNRTLGGVEKVKLTNSQMIAQARANGFISKYLQGDTLVLGYRTGSKSDCKKIVAWLCGES